MSFACAQNASVFSGRAVRTVRPRKVGDLGHSVAVLSPLLTPPDVNRSTGCRGSRPRCRDCQRP